MKVIIHSVVPTNQVYLMPAPNIADLAYIKEACTNDQTPRFENLEDFVGKPLEILANYRANLIYLVGDLSFYRSCPSTTGGNGYAGMPSENCRERGYMVWKGNDYTIDAEFI